MEISRYFTQTLDQVTPCLEAITNWTDPLGPGKWSRLEILGHLLDSAANNHQRFVRALAQPELEWPGYDQEKHVEAQQFAHADPQLMTTLVLSFNRYLAWLFGQFPADKLKTICVIGNDPPVTLETLARQYVAHAEHHLKQIVGETETVTWSGMPWPPQ
jgi:hypothetical protein